MDTFENRIDYLAKALEAEQTAAGSTDTVIRKMHFELARTYRSLARFTRAKVAVETSWTQTSVDGSLIVAQTDLDQRFVANQPAFMHTVVEEIPS